MYSCTGIHSQIQKQRAKFTSFFLTSKFSSDVLWNIGSLALLGVSGVLMNSVIAHYQSPSSLGVFNQIFAFYMVLSQLAVGGMHLSILKYLSHTDDQDLIATIVSSGLVTIAGTAVVVAILAFRLSTSIGGLFDSRDLSLGIRFICPALVLFSINKGLMMVLNGTRRMRAYAVFQASRYLLLILSVIGLIVYGLEREYLAWCFLISEFLLTTALATFVYKSIVAFGFRHITGSWICRHFSFGLRGFLGGMLSDLNTRMDIFLVGYFHNDASVGIYSFAATLAGGFSQITYVLKQNLDPIIGRLIDANSTDQLRSLMRGVRVVFLPLMLALSIVSALLFPEMVRLFIGNAFLKSWPIFVILLAGIMINAGFRPFQGVFLLMGRPGLHSLFFLTVVLSNAVLNVVFIQRLGITGAAVATSLALLIESFLIFFGIRTVLRRGGHMSTPGFGYDLESPAL